MILKNEAKAEDKKFLAKNFTSKLVARRSFWAATQKSNNEKEKEVMEIFSQICIICFGLISKICQENYENQIECFKYFHPLKKMVNSNIIHITYFIFSFRLASEWKLPNLYCVFLLIMRNYCI